MKKFLIVLFVLIISSTFIFAFSDSYTSNDKFLEQACNKAWEGEYDDAIIDLNKIIEKSPKYYPAYFARAGIELLKGEYSKAIKDYKKVNELTPDYTEDVEYFMDIANQALKYPEFKSDFINIYNISLNLGEGYVIKPDKKEKKVIQKLLYTKGFYNAHLKSLEIFCKDSGYSPKKYSDLFKLASKDVMAEIPNLEKQIRKEFFPMITKMEEEMLDSFVEVHKKDFNELKQEILKKENHNLTKKEYCSYFDENAQDLVKYKMNMYKF